MTSEGLVAFSRALTPSAAPLLDTLDLRYNYSIGAEGYSALARALSDGALPNLKYSPLPPSSLSILQPFIIYQYVNIPASSPPLPPLAGSLFASLTALSLAQGGGRVAGACWLHRGAVLPMAVRGEGTCCCCCQEGAGEEAAAEQSSGGSAAAADERAGERGGAGGGEGGLSPLL